MISRGCINKFPWYLWHLVYRHDFKALQIQSPLLVSPAGPTFYSLYFHDTPSVWQPPILAGYHGDLLSLLWVNWHLEVVIRTHAQGRGRSRAPSVQINEHLGVHLNWPQRTRWLHQTSQSRLCVRKMTRFQSTPWSPHRLPSYIYTDSLMSLFLCNLGESLQNGEGSQEEMKNETDPMPYSEFRFSGSNVRWDGVLMSARLC